MPVPSMAVLSPSTEIDNYYINQEVLMSDLVVIVYPSEEKAEQVRQRLINLQREYLITINDAVIALKNEKGEVKLNQLVNTTAVGAASGSFWGLLVGLLFSIRSSAWRSARRQARSVARCPISASMISS
jgi:hypothetical protein